VVVVVIFVWGDGDGFLSRFFSSSVHFLSVDLFKKKEENVLLIWIFSGVLFIYFSQ
jgi:hypothetical protein